MTDVYDVHVVHSAKGYGINCVAAYTGHLIVGCDDGSLRILQANGDTLDNVSRSGSKAELPVMDVVHKCSKEPKKVGGGIKSIQVVPEWGAAVVSVDGGLQIHKLDNLGRPALAVPGSRGCSSHACSPTVGMMALASRTAVRLLSWSAPSHPYYIPHPVASSSSSAGREGRALDASALTFVCEYTLEPIHNGSAREMTERPRRNSAANLLLALGSPSTGPIGPLTASIVNVSWAGSLLCLSVIRRADMLLHPEDDDVPVLQLVAEEDLYTASGVSRSDPSRSDTGYRLSYLYVHPWSGQLLREVRAGQAPPIDSLGNPTAVPSGSGEGTPPTLPVLSAVANVLGLAPTLSPLMATLSAATAGALAASWGTSAVVREPASLEDGDDDVVYGASAPAAVVGIEEGDDDGGGGGEARSLRRKSVRASVGGRASIARTSSHRTSVAGGGGGAGLSERGSMVSSSAVQSTGEGDEGWKSGRGGSGGRRQTLQSIMSRLRADSADSLLSMSSSNQAIAAGVCVVVALDFEAPEGGGAVNGEVAGSGGGALYGAATQKRRSTLPLGNKPRPAGVPRPVGYLIEDQGPYSGILSTQEIHIEFSNYPIALYASPSFPYVIGVESDGASIYHRNIGIASQHIKIPSVLGLSVCPVEARARLDFASKRDPKHWNSLVHSGHSSQADTMLHFIRGVLGSPERVFIFSRNGIVMIRMVPVVMQVAALISRRPPLFEAALALCDHFNTIRSRMAALEAATRSSNSSSGGASAIGAGEGGDAGFSLDAVGGVTESKIRQIRAQFGYQLFATGDFQTSLSHLAHAHEPVTRILSLFPQFLPRGWYVSVQFPVKMPVMIDVMLPHAVRPLIPFLLAKRKRLGCGTNHPDMTPELLEELEFAGEDDGEGEGGASLPSRHPRSAVEEAPQAPTPGHDVTATGAAAVSKPFPPPVLVDTVLLTVLLWLEAYLEVVAGNGGRGADHQLKRVRSLLSRLLASPNCIDVEEGELQLRVFGKAGVELVTLYRGKGMHMRAVSLLAGTVGEAALFSSPKALNALLQVGADYDSLPASALLPRAAVVSALRDVAQYSECMRQEAPELLAGVLTPLLTGAVGAVGVVYGLHILLHACSAAGYGLTPSHGWELLTSTCTAACDSPAFWRLQGDIDSLPHPGGDEAETLALFLHTQAATTLAAAATQRQPDGGWRPLLQVAFLEYMVRHGLGPKSFHQKLVDIYLALLREVGPGGGEGGSGDLEGPHQPRSSNTGAAATDTGTGVAASLRARLLHHLSTSPHYSPATTLPSLPTRYWGERAEVFRRLGRHEEALRIFAQDLGDTAAAERYCERVVAAGADSGLSTLARSEMNAVYTALLRVYFPDALAKQPAPRRRAVIADHSDESSSSSAVSGENRLSSVGGSRPGGRVAACFGFQTPAAVEGEDVVGTAPLANAASRVSQPVDRMATIMPFLLKNLGKLDPSQALQMLPPDVSLQSVAPLVLSALISAGDAARSVRTARELAVATNLVTCDKSNGRRERWVRVDRTLGCAICTRKLVVGGQLSSFVLRPAGDLVHLACHTHSEAAAAASHSAQAGGADHT